MDGACSMTSLREVIYGSSSDESTGAAAQTSGAVHAMAAAIYGEFDRMIKNYGDSVVTTLVPQMVAVLEYWDKAIKEKHKLQLECDLQLEDKSQLLKQFEKERQLRRTAEQALIETQDSYEEQRKEMADKIASLEKNIKLLELKSKLQIDQSQRFEEKEAEMKKEYEKLHCRYTELFKSYMDYADRTKAAAGQDKNDLRNGTTSSEATRDGFSVTSSSLKADSLSACMSPEAGKSSPAMTFNSKCLSPDLEVACVRAAEAGDSTKVSGPVAVQVADVVTGCGGIAPVVSLDMVPFDELEPDTINDGDNDGNISDDGSELTESHSESQSEDLSARYDYGVTREVENLIRENQELVEMKNALNVVKDDLICQLEQKSAEVEMLRVDLLAARSSENRLVEELKKLRTPPPAAKPEEDEDGDTPSQRRRFTRVEMARVIYERNQYKERLVELQETVRWTEMVRARSAAVDASPLHAQGVQQQKKSGLWGFFSGLIGAEEDGEAEKPIRSVHTVQDV